MDGRSATSRARELLAKLPDRSAILDGEIAVPDKRGVTHLALLDPPRCIQGGREVTGVTTGLIELDRATGGL
jgi:hypothetical protein